MSSKNPSMRQMLSRAFCFGFSFSLVFLLVEGTTAPWTHWGSYTSSLPLIWRTPVYLLPIWLLIGIGVAVVDTTVGQWLHWKTGYRVLTLGVTMTLAAWLGESLGSYLDWWTYYPGFLTWLGVPVWIPLSYGIAFSFAPILLKSRLGGIFLALSIGISWILLRFLFAGLP
jgi:hypothetical protein